MKKIKYILITLVLIGTLTPVARFSIVQAQIPDAAKDQDCVLASSAPGGFTDPFRCEKPPGGAIGKTCYIVGSAPAGTSNRITFTCQYAPNTIFGTCISPSGGKTENIADYNCISNGGVFTGPPPVCNYPQVAENNVCVPLGVCTTTNGRNQSTINDTAADCRTSTPPGSWVQIIPTPSPTPSPNPSTPPSSPTTSTDYTLLAPFPTLGLNTVPVAGQNALGDYLNVMIKILIGLAAVAAMVMIVMGGIQYMTSELPGVKGEGKEKITNAILGLLIALGAWLILYTINPDLLNTNVNVATTTIVGAEDTPQAPVNGKYGTYASGADWATTTGGTVTVLPNGVVSKGPECATVGQQNCVSLKGLNPYYINVINANCSNCQPITVTGGTEFWMHRVGTTHQPGSPTVDLRLTTQLTQYIMGGTTTPVNGQRYSRDGISFLYELNPNHWHAGN